MKYETAGQMKFFSEMSERETSAREFFSDALLSSLGRNFGLHAVLITYFDTRGSFLSWIDEHGMLLDSPTHPYRDIAKNDVIRHLIYREAVRDKLTYFNVAPRLYRASDIISAEDYPHSPYVKFIGRHFGARYSVTMAFGINAYIQLTFFKAEAEGDFTEGELESLREIYVYVANFYKNFKKHEQAHIVADIQAQVIAGGDKAYLITDDFMHVMSCNQGARAALAALLGEGAAAPLDSGAPCSWLPFLLGAEEEHPAADAVQTRVIRDYTFRVHTYDQSYSNGIIDRYHWITISHHTPEAPALLSAVGGLTNAEQRVAALMYQGLTYKAIARELVISYHTVKKHVENIYAKCQVSSRYELSKWLEANSMV